MSSISLIKIDLLNIPVSLCMALAAEVHLAEGQLQHFKSTLNKVKSLRSQVGV
jgi:hypothetical protein